MDSVTGKFQHKMGKVSRTLFAPFSNALTIQTKQKNKHAKHQTQEALVAQSSQRLKHRLI